MAKHEIEIEHLSIAEKRALLSQLLRQETAANPLASKGQEALWFLYQTEPTSSAYNIMYAVHVHSPINVDAMKRAFLAIFTRHDALHTTFSLMEGKLLRKLSPNMAVPFESIDVANLSEEACRKLVEDEAHQPFDLEHGPVCKMRIFLQRQDSSIILFVVHHIAVDGASLDVLMNELCCFYRSFACGVDAPSLPTPVAYEKFVAWEDSILRDQACEELINYWRHALPGPYPELELPQTARPHATVEASNALRPDRQTFQGAEYLFTLRTSVSEQARHFAQVHSVTLYVLLQSTLKALLYRYTREANIVVGTYAARRELCSFEEAVGYYLNTLVLKSTLDEKITFRQLVANVQQRTFDALEHQNFPFPLLVQTLQPKRTNSRSPMFDVVFNWVSGKAHDTLNNFFLTSGNEKRDFGVLLVSNYAISRRFARFDLEITMGERLGEISSYWQYNTAILSAETIAAMAGHFEQLLLAAVQSPDIPILSLDMLPKAEFNTIVHSWNQTTSPYDALPIHRLIERQGKENAFDTAVTCRGQTLSYFLLNARANQVAHALRASGVGPGSLVGLCTERSMDMLIGMLAILKAGAGYVPLDPAYPSERIRFMLSDSSVKTVLVSMSTLSRCKQDHTNYLVLDDKSAAFLKESEDNLEGADSQDTIAYVMYTSGSTGKPKGVMVTHRNYSALFHWADSIFSDEELKCVLASTSICFDISGFEIFYPLVRGASVNLVENALHLNELPADAGVTLINTVPSVMDALLKTTTVLPPSVKVVTLVGEPLRKSLVDRIYAAGNVEKVFNLYGPTEDTVFSTWKLVEKNSDKEPSIGRPLPNTQTYICNEALKPVPIFHIGELLLGGDGLAQGYYQRPELTKERFVKNPFDEQVSTRLYKTGDLARYLPSGEIEYLGRLDSQVKIRGFRVELGEIEALLSQHVNVRSAAVIAKEGKSGKRLIAFIESKSRCKSNSPNDEIDDLRTFVEASLPAFMVPSAFVFVYALPMTPNGKIDRKALHSHEGADVEDSIGDGKTSMSSQMPRTQHEELVATIWAELLHIPQEKIETRASFYDLGGHSLLYAQMAQLIGKRLQKQIPVHELFRFRDVASLAAWLEGTSKEATLLESHHRAEKKRAALARISVLRTQAR